jgi:hypothetical protein
MTKMLHLRGSDFTKIPHSKLSLLDTASYQCSSFSQDSCFQSVGSRVEKLTPSQELLTGDTSD